MSHCNISIYFLPKSEKRFIDDIVKRQKTIAETFLKHKNQIHKNEDPNFRNDLSDIFDIRHWNVVAFSSKSNDDSELFDTEVNTMREKLFKETSKKIL